MHKLIISLILVFAISISLPAYCGVVQGGVEKQGLEDSNQIVDSETNEPVSRAKISIPQKNYRTYSDSSGRFELGSKIDGQTVMSVEKAGYKPFSMTINEKMAATPLVLGIEKSTPQDITIETNMFHLGDNNFSDVSANAREFRVKTIGPYYSKNFKIKSVTTGSASNLVIGSIIGVDTELAKSMGQNKVTNAFSSPPEVFFNGSKIAEIQVNGDGQRIRVPNSLIKQNQLNEVTIKTGRNLMQRSYVDYDDIEFMNLSIENY